MKQIKIFITIPIFIFVIFNHINANEDSFNESMHYSPSQENIQNQFIRDYNNANLLFYQQKFKDALKIYENLIKSYPEQEYTEIVNSKIAEVYEKLGKYDSSIEIYKELLISNPNDYRLKYSLANLLRWQKKYNESIKIFKEIMPENDNLYELIGNIYIESGKYDLAIKTWYKIIEKNPNDLNNHSQLAYIFYQQGMISEGIDTYLNARNFLNDQNIFAFELAELYEFQMEYKKAVNEYINILDKNPEQFENIQSKLITIINKDKDIFPYAIEKNRNFIEKNLNNINIRILLVNLLLKNGQIDSAIKENELILKIRPDKRILVFTFAEELEKMDYKEEAIKIYEKVEFASPSYQLAQSKIIELLVATKKYEEAIQKCESFVKTSPRQDYLEITLYYLGVANIELKKFQEARKFFIQITQVNKNSNFYNNCLIKIADTYFMEGNYEQAIKDYSNILSIYNTQAIHDYAFFMLSKSTIMLERYDEGLKKLENFVEKYKTSLYVNDAFVEIDFLNNFLVDNKEGVKSYYNIKSLNIQGKYEEAIQQLDMIINTYTESNLSQFAYFLKGEIYFNYNRYNESIIIFQTLINENKDSVLSSYAQDKIAYIYAQKIGDKNKAIEAYKKIMINYPNSLLVYNARENIRKLQYKEVNIKFNN